jgi:isatin hydrolase
VKPERIVDLSLTIAEELPCSWPTHMPFQQKVYNYFADAGMADAPVFDHHGPYQTRWLLIDEHTGTHFDAPAHFIPPPDSGLDNAGASGSVTAERVPLDQLIGAAAVIDISVLLAEKVSPGVSPYIQPAHIMENERVHGEIKAGMIVLFRSGWDQLHYKLQPDGSKYVCDPFVRRIGQGWPALSVAAAQELLARGVTCVGIDSPSMGSAHDGGPVHVLALSQGCVFIENLANLHELPERGAKFFFAPLRLARGTGAPGRAFALVD